MSKSSGSGSSRLDVAGQKKQLVGQFRKLWPLLLAVYLPILAGLAVLVVVNQLADIPLRYFFIDPVAEFNAPMYIGLLSNFGVLLWGAAATVCLYGGWILRKFGTDRRMALFLIASGLVSALLMFDDLYLLHEEVLPDHLHVPQKLVIVGYAGIVAALLIGFAGKILETDYLVLVLAFVFFSLSVLIDLFVTPEEFDIGPIAGRHLIEDGLKLLGIATWALYFVRTCVQQTNRNLSGTPAA